MSEQRKTICNRDCPDACSIVATVENDRIVKLSGDRSHPITKGFLCYRTNHFLSTQYHPERLRTPLYRENTEQPFRAITWDEALSIAAKKLTECKEQFGPASIFHYRSGGSLGLLKTVSDYFFEQFGPVSIKRGDICSGAGDYAQMEDFGEEDSHDLFDLENSKSIILWGKNLHISSPHLIPLMKSLRAKGTKLYLIDPVAHRTRELCDGYVQVRPGGDVALVLAIVRRLFEQEKIHHDAANFCEGFEAFRSLAFARTVEEHCAEAEVPVAQVDLLAGAFSRENPTAILVGWGMGRRRHGAVTVRALDALSALTGNVGVPGGGVSFYFKRRGAFDTSFVKGEKAAPRTLCEPLFGKEILEAKDPPIAAVWITAGNPVVMLPESATSERALRSRSFVVVVDSMLTDTAQCAHLVLPTTTLLEADDLVGSYGHHYIGVARPVVAPPEGVKSDLDIIHELAKRVGLEQEFPSDPRWWKRRMMEPKLGPRGLTLEQLEQGAVRNPLAPKVLFAEKKFPTPSGKMRLMTSVPAFTALTDHTYPLLLSALSTDRSQSSQWVVGEDDGPLEVTVHPESANGIPHGSLAKLSSRIASITVRVVHDDTQRRDLALTAKGGHLRKGRCANLLVQARVTDFGEGGALYDEPVRLDPVETTG